MQCSRTDLPVDIKAIKERQKVNAFCLARQGKSLFSIQKATEISRITIKKIISQGLTVTDDSLESKEEIEKKRVILKAAKYKKPKAQTSKKDIIKINGQLFLKDSVKGNRGTKPFISSINPDGYRLKWRGLAFD